MGFKLSITFNLTDIFQSVFCRSILYLGSANWIIIQWFNSRGRNLNHIRTDDMHDGRKAIRVDCCNWSIWQNNETRFWKYLYLVAISWKYLKLEEFNGLNCSIMKDNELKAAPTVTHSPRHVLEDWNNHNEDLTFFLVIIHESHFHLIPLQRAMVFKEWWFYFAFFLLQLLSFHIPNPFCLTLLHHSLPYSVPPSLPLGVHICAIMLSCADVGRQGLTLAYLPQSVPHLILWDTHWIWSMLFYLGLVSSKSLGSTCLYHQGMSYLNDLLCECINPNHIHVFTAGIFPTEPYLQSWWWLLKSNLVWMLSVH